MHRWLSLVLAPLALTAVGLATAAVRPPAHTKRQAEVNVLRVVAVKWRVGRLQGLVNPRTHLLANNTEAVCRARGRRRAGNRYTRFVCVVRPHAHTPRQGLYLSYRALPAGRFTVRWLVYRRH